MRAISNRLALLLTLPVVVVACGGGPAHIHVNTSADEERSPSAAPVRAAVTTEAPAPAPEITFTRKPPTVGRVTLQRTLVRQAFLVRANVGDTYPVTNEVLFGEVESLREEILGVKGQLVTKTRVTFVDKGRDVIHNGHQRHTRSVVAGKTYVIERGEDGVLSITTDKGGKVSNKEGDEIARRFRLFGLGDVSDVLPNGTVRVGESAGALAAGFKLDLARSVDGDIAFGDVAVTLSGTRDVGGTTCGVFRIVLPLSGAFESVRARTRLEGEMVVRTSDGAILSMTLDGPVAVDADVRGVQVWGDGKSHMVATWEPQ